MVVTPRHPELRAAGTGESAWEAWPGLANLPVLPVPPQARLVILAPHPDDEVLALGGLLHRHRRCELFAVTDGEASHPDSPLLGPQDLRTLRYLERAEALHRLGRGDLRVRRLGHADGAVDRDLLASQIAEVLEPGDVCVATWRGDGHPDHEAVGHAARLAAAQRRVGLWEYPVWTWHWAVPGDSRVPWRHAVRLPMSQGARAAKARAIDAFATQVRPLGPADPRVIVPDSMVAHFARDFEIVFLDPASAP